MQHFISWFEIPATNFKRAVSFYSAILGIDIEENDSYGMKMGLFPSDGENISGAIVEGEGCSPSKNGVLVYLNGGKDLQTLLDKVSAEKGTILVPKTQISPDMGYFGIFLDSEGNRIGVHSME